MKTGSIVVITGPMRSGKSEELLRRVKRFQIAEKHVLIFKPDQENRFEEDHTASRDFRQERCIIVPASSPGYINAHVDESVDVVAIEEAQFYSVLSKTDKTIVDVVQGLSDRGIEVVVAGLDMDTERKPFHFMPELMAVATEVIKLKAVCEGCREEPAAYSYREGKTSRILVGDGGYEALCQTCYNKKKK